MESNGELSERIPFRILILGDGSVRTIPLTGNRWVVGRSQECTIPLRDPTVSRRHLVIERVGEAFRFQDLGGSNPILIDGRPATQGTLMVGQTLLVGLTRLTLERRHSPTHLVADTGSTVVLSREVIDEELPSSVTGSSSFVATARRVLERIEWTFADLGGLDDVAEPLLDLALSLTGRRRGLIARFLQQGGIETLATLDAFGHGTEMRLPEQVLTEAKRLGRPNLLTLQEQGRSQNRLVIPLGNAPDGVLVLEEPVGDAPQGQDLLRLGRTLGTVVWHRLQETSERLRLRDEVQRLRFHGTTAHNALLASTRLQEIRQQLRELANQDAPVLLVGEDGSEHEDLAHYLHVEGSRAKGPFIAVNAAAIPDWRQEKDLLGDVRGHAGALEQARGGTLFVDHIDHLPEHLQARLIEEIRQQAALASGEPGRRVRLVVGSNSAPSKSPANWSPALLEVMHQNPITIPPLRTDARDIMALAELFLSDMGCTPDGSPRLLSERSKRLLVGHSWPGNVRELRQVLESAAARAGNQPIAPRHLPEELGEAGNGTAASNIPTLEEMEQRHIREVLQRVGGNRAQAAQALGIAASTLYEKLKRYAIEA